jgi:hypothetical protein
MGMVVVSAGAAEYTSLSKADFLDKCRGAWAGQMIGVCYGAPYEFNFNGMIIPEPLQPWKPDRIAGAIAQDDIYVEMTFLEAIEEHGIYITPIQAGQVFAESEYLLWHANHYGRENIRRGVMPPLSGHPAYNVHADDIDFQIEADLLGILCPQLPQESTRLCEVFGSLMNYGDGIYGGMFVAGMYAYAYGHADTTDVHSVVLRGLDCIPEQSEYAACIRDVIRWHDEHRDDWQATWQLIEDKWQDDRDCAPGDLVNIDAKLNGAYIVMGLLYGEGDIAKTLEVSTRCGQDADCNPSNAVGVLGCMMGYKALDEKWTSGISAIADQKFSHTDYSFETLIPACQRVTEAIIRSEGGKVEGDKYLIPVVHDRKPAPLTLEQWVNQDPALHKAITRPEMQAWNADWHFVDSNHEMLVGLRAKALERDNVLVIHPVSGETPATLVAQYDVPVEGRPKLRIEAASHPKGDCRLIVWVDAQPLADEVIDTRGKWRTVTVDLMPFTGTEIHVRIENHATDWEFEGEFETCYLDEARLVW